MDGVQLLQGYIVTTRTQFLPLSPQESVSPCRSRSQRSELPLESPSGFEHGTPGWSSSTLTVQ